MAIKIIAAVAVNGVIGKDGRLPWRLPDDLRWFKGKTGRNPVVMGRKTYWSLPDRFRPLPDRENIILTRQAGCSEERITVVGRFEEVLERAMNEDIFVIGGGEIYALALPHASEMNLTRVQAIVTGETFFPAWDWDKWKLKFQESVPADGRNRYSFMWEVWKRR
jgi:dihydrofolate reductase